MMVSWTDKLQDISFMIDHPLFQALRKSDASFKLIGLLASFLLKFPQKAAPTSAADFAAHCREATVGMQWGGVQPPLTGQSSAIGRCQVGQDYPED